MIKMNASLFRSILSTIKPIALEPTIHIVGKSEGLRVLTTDPAKIIGLNLLLHKANFETFEIDDTIKNFTFGLEKLTGILDNIGSEDKIELDIQPENLKVKIVGSHERNFKIPLVNPFGAQPKGIPNYTYFCKIKMLSKGLETALGDIRKFSDESEFKIFKDEFHLKSPDDSVLSKFVKDSTDILDYQTEKEFKTKFSAEYLFNIVSASKAFSDIVNLELNENDGGHLQFVTVHPIILEYWIMALS